MSNVKEVVIDHNAPRDLGARLDDLEYEIFEIKQDVTSVQKSFENVIRINIERLVSSTVREEKRRNSMKFNVLMWSLTTLIVVDGICLYLLS